MQATPPPTLHSSSGTDAAYYERAYQAQLAIAMAELQRRKARDVWLANERAARKKAEEELEVTSALKTCAPFSNSIMPAGREGDHCLHERRNGGAQEAGRRGARPAGGRPATR